MATSGPGVTSLVTPARRTDAFCSRGAITSLIGTYALLEADIRGITMPITKHNFLITDPADIPRTSRMPSTSPPADASGGTRRHRERRSAGCNHALVATREAPARLSTT
jgi:hypothetical protein